VSKTPTLPDRPTRWAEHSRKIEIPIDQFQITAQLTRPDHPDTPVRGTIVLVPGFTGAKEDFIAITPLLNEAGWAVLAYDQPGQHESRGPSSTESYSLENLAIVLAEISDWANAEHGGSTHVVGHSFGGLVVSEAVAGSRTQLTTATLLCSGPGALPPERRGAIPLIVPLLPQTPLADIWQMKMAMDEAANVALPNAETLQMLLQRWVNNSPHAMLAKALLLTSDLEIASRLSERHDVATSLHVVTGENDDAWPVSVQEAMAEQIGATFDLIDGAGHSPALERPAATAAVLTRIASAQRGVGALITREDGAVLLIKRGQEPYLGCWSLPGGNIQSGESARIACRREVLEETGLSVEVGHSLGHIEIPMPDDTTLYIEDFRARLVDSAHSTPRAGDDAADVGWFHLAEIHSLNTTPGLTKYLAQWGVKGPG